VSSSPDISKANVRIVASTCLVTVTQLPTVRTKFRHYTVVLKNKTPNYCPYLLQILTDFQNYFTSTLSRKFAINISLQIPLHYTLMASIYTTSRNISLQKSHRLKAQQRQTKRVHSKQIATAVGELALSH